MWSTILNPILTAEHVNIIVMRTAGSMRIRRPTIFLPHNLRKYGRKRERQDSNERDRDHELWRRRQGEVEEINPHRQAD